MLTIRPWLLTSVVAVTIGTSSQSQAPPDPEINSKIRAAVDAQRIMSIVQHLSDRFGPRTTGTPNYDAAVKWTMGELRSWGLSNVHAEPFDFGSSGWVNERATGHVTSPYFSNLVVQPVGWTPSTSGTVKGRAVYLDLAVVDKQQVGSYRRPTGEELDAYLTGMRSKVRGAIVLAGHHYPTEFMDFRPPLRESDEVIRRFLTTPTAPRSQSPAASSNQHSLLSDLEVTSRVDAFLKKHGALAQLRDAGLEFGLVRGRLAQPTSDLSGRVPTVEIRTDDYGRIVRTLADAIEVQIELNVVNRTFPRGRTSSNVISEIKGHQSPEQVVMFGAHLDSWYAGNGAADNAIGCAIMLEALRVLEVLGVKPRRTIRLALWGGEEWGLLGSTDYVAKHFGTVENPKPEFGSLSVYVNLDTGSGRIRAAQVFGPTDAAQALTAYLAPFSDLGVQGAVASDRRPAPGVVGGSDSAAFSAAGLPAAWLRQDPITRESWHTNIDTVERLSPEDARKAAIVVASLAYHLANREELLPRLVPTAGLPLSQRSKPF